MFSIFTSIIFSTFKIEILIFTICITSSFLSQSPTSKESTADTDPKPIFTNYKGVAIGTPIKEVHQKLKNPSTSNEKMDYYAISDKEAVQIHYDAENRVQTICITYHSNNKNAPDAMSVIGEKIEVKDGIQYKLIRYLTAGYWVSYTRTVGDDVSVVIVMQKILD
jgi:flagellar basal body-associated protein FliL